MATSTNVKGMVFGADRKLRPIWRPILYLLAAFAAIQSLFVVMDAVLGPPPPGPLPFDPLDLSLVEGVNLAAALLVTGLFAWCERRRIDSYGLPVERALGLPTFEGFVIGVIQSGLIALAMLALGAMRIHGLALSGPAIATSAVAWLGACLCIGIGEEYLFRGYFLQSLWKAIGFWPASIVIAAMFAGVHYLLKPGENAADLIALVSFSLLCCYSVRRTGNLWFAVGLHVAYDFMQLFVIGTPNGGQIPSGRLLDSSFSGPAWLTGGPLGTEASWLAYPLDALAFAYLWWRFRKHPSIGPRDREVR
jgi:uncharacterized protein